MSRPQQPVVASVRTTQEGIARQVGRRPDLSGTPWLSFYASALDGRAPPQAPRSTHLVGSRPPAIFHTNQRQRPPEPLPAPPRSRVRPYCGPSPVNCSRNAGLVMRSSSVKACTPRARLRCCRCSLRRPTSSRVPCARTYCCPSTRSRRESPRWTWKTACQRSL